MPKPDRIQMVRDTYGADESGDRSLVERHLAPEFRFYSPAFEGEKIVRAEVYFGRELAPSPS